LIPCRSKKALIPFRSGEAFVLGLFFFEGVHWTPCRRGAAFFFLRGEVFMLLEGRCLDSLRREEFRV
jgi:hypothetical protein